jgi:hypothetical protein
MRTLTPRSAARVNLHDGPVCQDIGRHVDFMLGATMSSRFSIGA